MNEISLKQLPILFNRITIQGLWLAELGILFEIEKVCAAGDPPREGASATPYFIKAPGIAIRFPSIPYSQS